MKHYIIASALIAIAVPSMTVAQDAKPAMTAAITELSATQYVEIAASSDMFEIESSKLALEKAQNADVKEFAGHMVTDHTITSKDLMGAAQAAGITVPTTMMPKHAAMVEKLKASDAAAFDAAYIEAQSAAHEEAVALHSAYSETGKDPAFRAVAMKAVPVVTEHLRHVKGMSNKA